MTIRDLINYRIEYNQAIKAFIFTNHQDSKFCLILNSKKWKVYESEYAIRWYMFDKYLDEYIGTSVRWNIK